VIPRAALAALCASAAYILLSATTVRGAGLVGEVTASWARPSPPVVLARAVSPAVNANALGPLVALQTRPTERVVLGPGAQPWAEVPLAVNAYTGGVPDWPARGSRALASAVAEARGSPDPGAVGLAAGRATVVGLGLALLALAHRFLRFHGSEVAASLAAFMLATDWSFVAYRRLLGGTEVLLQAAGLLVLWALWSRRWKGGRHGTVAIALGIGLGLHAKATFVPTLAAMGIAALATRRDRAPMLPPAGVRPTLLVGIPLLLVSPLLLAAAHHALLDEPLIRSHDTIGMQVGRLGRLASQGRESLDNLAAFLGHPLSFFSRAYGTVPAPAFSAARTLTFTLAAAGAVLEWRARTPSPSAALLRFLSVAVPLQLILLFAANRDLHHLAQATTMLALLLALGCERLAAVVTPPRSWARAGLAAAMALPACAAGIAELVRTDAVLATGRVGTFTADGQAAVVAMLRRHAVQRLVCSDYEIYGVIEALAPEIEVTHTWGAHSRGERDLGALRQLAQGGHYLSLRASAPFIYNWRARLEPGPVDALSDGRDNWAELYRVE
jgi:hypothetical protein